MSDNVTCGRGHPPTYQPTEFTCGSCGPTGAGPTCIPIKLRCEKLFVSVAGQFSDEEGGNRIGMVDLTTGADSILVNTSIGAVSGVVGLAVQDHRLY